MQEIERIRAALQSLNADLVLDHIDEQDAEIKRLRLEVDSLRIDAELWRKHDADKTARYARFVAKLNNGETP